MKNYLTIVVGFVVFLAFCCLVSEVTGSAEIDTGAVEPNSAVETTAKMVEPTRDSARAVADEVAVTVDGVPITEAALNGEVALQLKRMKMPQQMPPQVIEQYKKQLRERVLDRLIGMLLLDQQVKAANIVVTEEEVTEQIKKIAAQQGLSLDDFKKLVEAYGKSFDEWKQQMQFRKRLGYQKLMEGRFADKISVTDEDARKYYSENKKQFETVEQVRASHILIKPETSDPNADPNETKVRAKTRAEDMLKQIKGGDDFATLAKANSSCPSAARGGDLGFFGRGKMVPPFEKAAFELKVGQVSDVVETRFGYHIIKATGHKDAGVVSFDEAKDDIIGRLAQNKRQELTNKYIGSLKAKATIVYPPGKGPSELRPPTRKTPADSRTGAGQKDKPAAE
jgi:peptidyl-prolyl cis-trans isomerase C